MAFHCLTGFQLLALASSSRYKRDELPRTGHPDLIVKANLLPVAKNLLLLGNVVADILTVCRYCETEHSFHHVATSLVVFSQLIIWVLPKS